MHTHVYTYIYIIEILNKSKIVVYCNVIYATSNKVLLFNCNFGLHS